MVELLDDAMADRDPEQLPNSSLALDWDPEVRVCVCVCVFVQVCVRASV